MVSVAPVAVTLEAARPGRVSASTFAFMTVLLMSYHVGPLEPWAAMSAMLQPLFAGANV